MKIRTLAAVLLLSGGVTSAFAQTEDCNKNSSISHEAVKPITLRMLIFLGKK